MAAPIAVTAVARLWQGPQKKSRAKALPSNPHLTSNPRFVLQLRLERGWRRFPLAGLPPETWTAALICPLHALHGTRPQGRSDIRSRISRVCHHVTAPPQQKNSPLLVSCGTNFRSVRPPAAPAFAGTCNSAAVAAFCAPISPHRLAPFAGTFHAPVPILPAQSARNA